MTDQAHGSSLLQAREAAHLRRHNHNHNHLHRKDTDDERLHRHLYQHRRHLQQHNQHVRSHADSLITPPPSQQPQRRQVPDAVESVVTQVVRTVSVIQYVDGGGLPVAVSTIFSPQVTRILDPITGITVDSSLSNSPLPTLPTPHVPGLNPSNPASGNGSGGSISGSPPVQTGSLSSSSQPLLSVTSTPSSASPLPTRPGIFNSTSSAGLFNNTTLRSPFLNSSTISATPLSSSSLSETTITSSTSSSLSSSSFTTSRTVGLAGGFTPDGAVPAPTSTPNVAGAAPSAAPPATETLVGGVVGGICGMALLVFAVVFLLRWRRQHGSNHKMLSDATGNPGDNNRGFSSRMSERGIPFAVPAALAALSGTKKPGTPDEGEERGFVRVSGRKLPSVFHHGGDGYTNPFSDPRDSTISGGDQSIMYRDSEMFFSSPLGSGADAGFSPGGSRLKLGSPMRPESGIPVIQPGPARTPVQEGVLAFPVPSPAATALRPPPSPLPNPSDPIGRSRPSLDGSHASRISQSRFTENIA